MHKLSKNHLKKYIISICSWLAVFMPISFIFGRTAPDVILVLMALLFLVYIIVSQDFSCLRENWFKFAIIFWLYLVLRSFFAEDIQLSLLKVLPFIRFILFCMCMQYVVSQNPKVHHRMFFCLSVVVLFLVIDGYIQYSTNVDLVGRPISYEGTFYRLTGPFSKKIFGSTLTILCMPVMAVLVYRASKNYSAVKFPNTLKKNDTISQIKQSKHAAIFKDWNWYEVLYKLFAIAAGIVIYALVFLSGERSALVQITIAFIVIIAFLVRIKKAHLLMLLLAKGVVFVLGIYFLGESFNVDRQVVSILRIAQDYSESVYGKLWNAGLKIGWDNPIFGVGGKHFDVYCSAISDFCKYHPHNIYIEFFAEFGLIGLILFLSMIGSIIWQFFTISNGANKSSFLFYLAAGTLIAALVRFVPVPSSGFFKSWYAVPIWLMFGWCLSVLKYLDMHRRAKQKL